MKIYKCCNCKSREIQQNHKEIYCKKCGLILAATTEYVAGVKIYLPYGRLYG